MKFEFAEVRDFGGEQVAQGIGGVVASGSLFVDVGLEDIAGTVGVARRP